MKQKYKKRPKRRETEMILNVVHVAAIADVLLTLEIAGDAEHNLSCVCVTMFTGTSSTAMLMSVDRRIVAVN